jgi:hypothetical protein
MKSKLRSKVKNGWLTMGLIFAHCLPTEKKNIFKSLKGSRPILVNDHFFTSNIIERNINMSDIWISGFEKLL